MEEVNRFWFEELRPDHWFGGDSNVDAAIRERFGTLHASLKAQPPAPETLGAEALLAAVIVFDQFSRNLFRQSSEAYAADALALKLARHAVDTAVDRTLEPRRRQFLYMPFMHSEDRGTQTRSIELFTGLDVTEQAYWANHHKAIIDRFGRFPHRNALLGRMSTPEELEFLRTEEPFA
ncbi:MAG TPA: DUF924 family protein [Alphaproteobacteria bacterium]|nr:DUF924 family protein [Alphaproteobacteria bacterium]